ncbi:MAG: DNA primase [Thermodesulfovibrionales bacterium]|nr:DNA primase [Thermodesulfovibrionales bacterium]
MKSEGLPEEIKSRMDIVEFISDYVHLKKSGQNLKGLCPFHTEKTPSFMVSPEKQIFHCFGCGTGGDIITFLMKQENLSFREAVAYLAKKAGIRMPAFQSGEDASSEKRTALLRANEEASKYYMNNLKNSSVASAYLKKRGLSGESLGKFSIGFASEDKYSLLKHLKKLGFPESTMMDAGLIAAEGKGYRDWFRGRIMFPICNTRNDIIAFGGRVMDNSQPKYLNTQETVIFKKSDTLFGIHLAKDEIRKKGHALIVEGYLDVIVCHQYGFLNVVAPLGTALTPRHLRKLKLLAKQAILVFDGDDAGIAAARRSLAFICENDLHAKVLLLPKGDDPDSFLKKNGSEAFRNALRHTMSAMEFILKTAKGGHTETVHEALGIIFSVHDKILADELLGELSDRSGIHEAVLRSELDRFIKKTVSEQFTAKGAAFPVAPLYREEYLLLSALVTCPEKAGSILSELNTEDLQNTVIRAIFRKVKTFSGEITPEFLLDLTEEKERTLITGLTLNPGFDPEHIDRNITDCLQTIKRKKDEERRIQAEEANNAEILNSLLKEKRNRIKGIKE